MRPSSGPTSLPLSGRCHPGFMASEDEALRTPGMDPLRLVVPQLVNELGEIDEPIVLVLDDFHLTTQPGLHESVGYLVDHLPPKVCLVIATRADPPLPLGRLRASGEMTEIRSAQLALTPAETTQLLGERFDLHIDAAGVELLCRHTEGWPAALHLAGLSLQRQDDPKGFIERFAGDDRNVADYLTSEVLDRLSDEQKDFLLRTCILDHLSGPLCDVVAGVTGSAAMLEELDRSNLFLIPLDNRRDWYRYHHLFVEWLRHRLRRTNPELAPQLHARASRWHAENNSLGPAIAHAIAGGDQTRAAELIDRFLVRPSGVRWSTFWDWLAILPDDIVAGYPTIALARVAPALARGDFSSGWHWIGIAEAAIAKAPAELQSGYETIAGLYRAFCELAAGDKGVAQAALGGISEELRLAGSRSYPIAIGLAGMATFWSVGALESIPELQAASVARERASLPDGGVTALLAAAYAELGDWAAAEATAEAALALPRPWEHYSYPDRMAAHYAIGKVRLAAGRRDEGIDQIKQGLDLARGWVEPVFIAYGCLALAEAMEDYSEKRALVREARQLADSQQRSSPGLAVGDRGRAEPVDAAAAPAHRRNGVRRAPHRPGTRRPAPVAQQALPPGDRRRAVHLTQHRQGIRQVHLPQTRRVLPGSRPRCRPRAEPLLERDPLSNRQDPPGGSRRGGWQTTPPSGTMETMSEPGQPNRRRFSIRVAGRLSADLAEDLGGAAEHHPAGGSTLTGEFVDQSQIYGILDRLRQLGIEVLRFETYQPSGADQPPAAASNKEAS